MGRRLSAVGLLAVLLYAPACHGGSPPAVDLALANNAFAWDLYHGLSARGGNLFFSPFSVEVALAMTMAGARGETAAQMQQVLRLPESGPALHEAVARWQASVQPAAGDSLYTLTVASRLWGQAGLAFAQPFLKLTRDHYDAELGRVDFRGDAAAAGAAINGWVAEQTHGRITELVAAGALDGRTRLVLANAIYFLGTWRDAFAKDATTLQPFFTGGREVETPLMTQQQRFAYAEANAFQILELPYRVADGGGLSLVIILPREGTELADVAASLTDESFAAWVARLRRQLVRVHLPRFEMSAASSLADVLATLGMTLAFSAQADFGGMVADDGGAPLSISDVLHKAFVKVDEEGTEAAAATEVVMGITSVEPPAEPAVFRADHPFLFVIRDQRTGTVLFMGRLVDPRG